MNQFVIVTGDWGPHLRWSRCLHYGGMHSRLTGTHCALGTTMISQKFRYIWQNNSEMDLWCLWSIAAKKKWKYRTLVPISVFKKMGFPSYFGGRIIFDIFMVTYSYVSLVTYGCYILHMVATIYICTDLRPILVLFSSKILASAAFRAVFICFQSNISTVLGLPDNSLHHVQNRVHMFFFFWRLIY